MLRRVAERLEPDEPEYRSRQLEPGGPAWRAFLDAGDVLTQHARFAEADRVLERGLGAFPDDPDLSSAYAFSAHHSGRYREAVGRWEAAVRAAPDVAMGYAGLSANARALGEFARARGAIEDGLRRFPDDLIVVTEAARLAFHDVRFGDAVTLWRKAVACPEPHPEWLQGHAQSLVMAGALDEAEAAIASARKRHPDHLGLSGLSGLLAEAREDWPGAIAHWNDHLRRFPGDETGKAHLGTARHGLDLSRSDRPIASLPAHVDVVEDDAMRRLMLRFETIGEDCEFGLVQRHFGAEPLGLLRWNSAPLDRLMPALAHRFEGMGEPANTDMFVNTNKEFFIRDTRWQLGMHTFLFEGQSERDALYPKMCRRIVYLRDKLLADLAAGEKIFVFRTKTIGMDELDRLHAALNAFGPVRLLAVQTANPGEDTPGRVVEIGDRRFAGFLRPSGVDAHGTWDIAFDEWASLCEQVAAAS